MREILVTVSAGIFGMAGAGLLTWVFGPLLRARAGAAFAPGSGALLVLIPAHNEERTLPETIRSVLESAKQAGLTERTRIVVGVDACSDHTAEVAQSWGAQAEVVEFGSKWKTLASLATFAKQDEWVALVDAGAIWPKCFLTDVATLLADPSVLGVAPAYFPSGASAIERFLWRFEAFWKRGENRAGGPVSVHGATVLYRAEALTAAFAFLASFDRDSWLNDDVALPFAARLSHPRSSLVYWCPRETSRRISDSGLKEELPQTARRKRMVAGNLEWAVTLFPLALLSSPRIALVAIRRLLRIFWAYWMLLASYGALLAFCGARTPAFLATLGAVIAGTLLLTVTGKRGVVDAGLASLMAPLLVLPVLLRQKRAWT